MLFNNPLSVEKADRLIKLIEITKDDCVLDAGCGTGEFLIRLVESTGASGLGIDIDPESISVAKLKANERVSKSSCEFREENMTSLELKDNSFDVAVCIGSTHAFGEGEHAFPNTIQSLCRYVKPGGRILIGEGYWKQSPAAEYLELLGEPAGIYHNHSENIMFAEQYGLVPLYAAVSSDDEWDHFEWSYQIKVESQAFLYPEDPAIAEKLKRSRKWREGYLRWGRSTMGFGFYLFRN